MSLSKKLWLAIATVIVTAFVGTFVVSTLSAQKYFSEQLHVKNLDNATSLALSISQLPKDPVTIELLLAAQFDAGHYRLIRLTSPSGKVLIERRQEADLSDSPRWFRQLVPLSASPGISQVQDKWQQYGTLEVQSHDGYAYEELWRSTLRLIAWFILTALVVGLLSNHFLRIILRPLDAVVEQAHAIGERRYITNPEPSTTEFRKLVRVMNTLSGRVRKMLTDESGRVEELRKQSQIDPVSGLHKRESFLNIMDSRLTEAQNQYSSGLLVILRIANIATLNETIGWQATDELIHRIGNRLRAVTEQHAHWSAGRLSGSDFAVLTTEVSDPEAVGNMLLGEVRSGMSVQFDNEEDLSACAGATQFSGAESKDQVLARVDAALSQAEELGDLFIQMGIEPGKDTLPTTVATWRMSLLASMRPDKIDLGKYPVISSQGNLLHYESPARLKIGQEWHHAGQFIPWAARLDMMPLLDRLVFNHASTLLQDESYPRAINLSPDGMCDQDLLNHIIRCMGERNVNAEKFWFDVTEFHALQHLPEFRTFCMALKPLGCKIGLKHAGPHFSRIGELHDVGLDYLKVDAAMIRNIDSNPGNQAFVRGLCMVAHAIDLMAIAEGVVTEAEKLCLIELGFDGMTGPGVRLY